MGALSHGAWAAAPDSDPVGRRLGGVGSVEVDGEQAFSMPAAGLSDALLKAFAQGRTLFNSDWNVAPGRIETLDGIGPLFSDTSCERCHPRSGRGQPPPYEGALTRSLLVRLSIAGKDAHGGPLPHPVYGEQLQDDAIPGVPREAEVRVRWQEQVGRYPDGMPYTLASPTTGFHQPGYGPLGEGLRVSLRIAPAMIGLGLLEAVPDAGLLANADPDDADHDGISGRANRVWDIPTQQHRLGRFGWKASVATLVTQTVTAAALDMGIVSRLFARDDCTATQTACRSAVSGGRPEMSDSQLDALALYSRVIAVPLRRSGDNGENRDIQRGEHLFQAAGCAACHVRTLRTGDHEIPALANQTIHPYTDLLLHDMGEGLADHRPDFEADGREWRTPPLWGLGRIAAVNAHTRLLHDGRARNAEEAILWHGGEAEAARQTFMRWAVRDRAALLAFLDSL
ncbi:MAG: di-heme oxidoreductase family protein [Panacagrimonas sp.]